VPTLTASPPAIGDGVLQAQICRAGKGALARAPPFGGIGMTEDDDAPSAVTSPLARGLESTLALWPPRTPTAQPISGSTASASRPLAVERWKSLYPADQIRPAEPAGADRMDHANRSGPRPCESKRSGKVQNISEDGRRCRSPPPSAHPMVMSGIADCSSTPDARPPSTRTAGPHCMTRSRVASECRAHRIIAMVTNR